MDNTDNYLDYCVQLHESIRRFQKTKFIDNQEASMFQHLMIIEIQQQKST